MTIAVAIVEGDCFTRERFRVAIEQCDTFSVVAAVDSVRDAKVVLASQKMDILLLDLSLPDGSGHDVLHFVNEKSMRIDILVSTNFCDEDNVVSAIALGAVGYLLKDEAPEQVVAALLSITEGGAPISPKIAHCVLRRLREMPELPPTGCLSRSELDVLALVGKGLTNQDVARLLALSPHTVATHIKNIYGKLHICSRAEASREALKLGLI